MPDQRPVTEVDAARIRAALAGVRAAQQVLERAVAQALLNGASVRMVAELGVSANTVQKYGRAHGWPTEENRERFYESRYDREERETRDAAPGPRTGPRTGGATGQATGRGGPTSRVSGLVRPDRAKLAGERPRLAATLRGDPPPPR